MSRIDECYDSLNKAKDEVKVLSKRIEKYDDFFREYFMFDSNDEKYMPVKDLIALFDSKYKIALKRVILLIIGYPVIAIILGLLSAALNFGSSTTMSVVLTLYIVSNMDKLNPLGKIRRKKKFVEEVLEYLGNKDEHLELCIDEVMDEMKEYNTTLTEEALSKQKLIHEYENMLNEETKKLANEVIVDHGINAEIAIEPLIGKRKNKSLIKKNVNK